jgi:hypothetical protein
LFPSLLYVTRDLEFLKRIFPELALLISINRTYLVVENLACYDTHSFLLFLGPILTVTAFLKFGLGSSNAIFLRLPPASAVAAALIIYQFILRRLGLAELNGRPLFH